MILSGMFGAIRRGGPGPQPETAERRVQLTPLRFQMAKTLRVQQPAALVEFVDPFDQVNYTVTPVGQPALTDSIAGGRLTMSNPAVQQRNAILIQGDPVMIPQIFHSVEVTDISNGSAGYNAWGIGLCKDANNWFFFEYDGPVGQVRLDYNFNGAGGQFVDVRNYAITPPFQMGIGIVGDSVVGYVKRPTDPDWIALSKTVFYITPRQLDLQNYRPALLFASNGVSSVSMDNWTAGRFGSYGLRDITTVTDEAGLPYIVGNQVYATATLNDPVGQSYCGAVRIDLDTYDIEITSVIMVERGGKIQNDVAAHLIHYQDNSSRLCISTWGNGFGGDLQILHKLDAADLLYGAHKVSGMAALPMPNVVAPGNGVYDPMLVKDGGQWRLTFSFTGSTSFPGSGYTGFYPCVATSPDLVTWTMAGSDPNGAGAYEGSKFLRYEDGSLQILAGGPAGYRVYDESLNYIGPLRARSNGMGNTQPHPMVFGRGDYFHMLTFNGVKPSDVTASFTWGQLEASKSPRYRNPQSAYMLDRLSAYAATAWSLRRLSALYTGPCIRVQIGTSAGDPQRDIGFDSNGEVDQAAMLQFIADTPTAAPQLSVVRVYDQGGMGRDLVGNSEGAGPVIYIDNAFSLENGRPVLPITANYNQWFAPVSNDMLAKRDYGIFGVARNDAANGAGPNWYAMAGLVFSEYPGIVNDFGFGKMNSVLAHGQGNGFNDFYVAGTTPIGGALRQLGVTRNMGSWRMRLFLDGATELDTVTTNSQSEHIQSLQINVNQPWRLQELTIFATEPSDSDLAVILQSQAGRIAP